MAFCKIRTIKGSPKLAMALQDFVPIILAMRNANQLRSLIAAMASNNRPMKKILRKSAMVATALERINRAVNRVAL